MFGSGLLNGRSSSTNASDSDDDALPDLDPPSKLATYTASHDHPAKRKPICHEISDSSEDESACRENPSARLSVAGHMTESSRTDSVTPVVVGNKIEPVCLSSDDEILDNLPVHKQSSLPGTKRSDFFSAESDSDDSCSAAAPSLLDRLTNIGGASTSSLHPNKHITVEESAAVKKQKLDTELEAPTESKAEARQRKKAASDELKAQKQLEKERKAKEREEKKQEKEREALKQRMLREARKNATPKECMKFVTMVVDPGLMKFPCGAALLSMVQETNLKYDVQSQVRPNVVTFWREVTDVKETDDGKLRVETKEIVEDVVLLYTPVDEFIALADALVQSWTGATAHCDVVTLRSHVEMLQQLLENREVTLIVQGIEKHYKGGGTKGRGRGKKVQSSRCVISKQDVDMALVDIQLHTGCNICLLETDQEVAKTILQYAKAVAERPFKQERLQTGFSFHIDSGNSVKIDKDGVGLTRVWRQQLQQFKNVSAEVANAIIAKYPTPRTLWDAYQNCASDKEAELLLQDILVRRGYGVMENSRRVGKELSRRMYKLFTSEDPEFILT